MPFTLYHGPAGSGKTNTLLKNIASHTNPQEYALIIPHHGVRTYYEKQFISFSQNHGLYLPQLMGDRHHFLTQILKYNLPRLHQASARMVRLSLRKILAINSFPHLKKIAQYPNGITELSQTIINLKKNGISPDKLQQLLSPFHHEETNDFIKLFKAQEETLKPQHFYDEGDLYTTTLNLLKENKLKLPPFLKAIYIDNIFPLTWGDREIIRLLKTSYPGLDIQMAYSYDYAEKEDPYFYPSYSFLGEIADTTKYFHYTQNKKTIHINNFTNPASEIDFVIQNIIDLYKKGISPNTIGVVLPNMYYKSKTIDILKSHSIPLNTSFFESSGAYKIDDLQNLINLNIKDPQLHLTNQINFFKTLENFNEEWAFEEKLIFENFSDKEKVAVWKKEEETLLQNKALFNENGIKLFSLHEASSCHLNYLFITGFTQSNYPESLSGSLFFTSEMLNDPYLREILSGPTYKHNLASQYLKQSLLKSKMSQITFPLYSWNNQIQEISSLLEDISRYEVEFSHHKHPESIPEIKNTKTCFLETKLNRFNISALETYKKCPYQYYARYHLDLGEKEEEEIDIPPLSKGLFIHKILERLFKENTNFYQEAIRYDLYLKKINEKIHLLIEEEKNKNEILSKTPSLFKNSFCNRVEKTLAELLRLEIEQYREGKKTTLPKYFEWAFGNAKIHPLKIKTKYGDVFISGRIDRIDINEKQKALTLIDYKTGEIDSTLSLKNGLSLQIPLYLMAVEQHFPDFQIASALLVSLKEFKKSGLILSDHVDKEILGKHARLLPEEWLNLKTIIISKVGEIVSGIHNGNFMPKPEKEEFCKSCDYKDICHYKPNNPSPEDA